MRRIKINRNIKSNKLSQDFLEHLSPLGASEIKSGAAGFVFLIYDILLLLSLLTIMKIEVLWLLSPLIIIIHLWAIRLMLKNPYSTQFEGVLFTSVSSIIGAITYYILIHGISFYTLGITSVLYYVSINVIILISSSILIKYQIDKYSGDPTKKRVKKIPSQITIALYSVAPAIGLMLAYATADTVILKHYATMGVVFSFLLLFVYFAAKFTHRYFFMKANMDYVKFEQPSKKARIKLEKQGVEIK